MVFERLISRLTFAITLVVGVPLLAQQIDLVAAKQDQNERLQSLQLQLDAAKAKPDEPAVAELTKKLDTIRAEDLWSKTDGAPAMTIRDGDTFAPFNFAVLSDTHLSERQGPQRLQRALDLIRQRHDIAFVLVLGDIVWDRDPEQLKAILATAHVPVRLVYGNNDWKWISDGSYERAFGPRDYTFKYANCTFVCMYDCLPKGKFPEDHKGDFSERQW